MKRLLLFFLLCAVGFIHSAFDVRPPMASLESSEPVVPTLLAPYQNDRACRQWVDSVMDGLSLKQKVGQLFIYTLSPKRDKANRTLLQKVIKEYHVGGLLFSGGELANQVILTNEAQALSKVPLLMTFDGEWGLAMRLKQLPPFPKNMVLGSIRDDSLLYAYGREVARQLKEIGVQVNFAPVADVNINPRNPVINVRSFGASPELVARKVTAYARGLEDGGVLSVCKHFPGHGDTETDSHKALPRLTFDRDRLDSIELYPFRKAIAAGLGGMMVGHLEVPAVEPTKGLPSSLSRNVVYELLTREMQFQGLIFTDALTMKGAQGTTSVCLRALKAGNDLLLVPRRLKEEVDAVMAAIKSGELPEQWIDEKCRKVLTFKYALGLRKKPHIQLSGLEQRVTTRETKALITRLQKAAVTVVGHREGVLPLDVDAEAPALLYVGKEASISPLLQHLPPGVKPHLFALSAQPTAEAMDQLADTLGRYRRLLVVVSEQSLPAYRTLFSRRLPEVPTIWLSLVQDKSLQSLQTAVGKGAATILARYDNEELQAHIAQLLYGQATADGRLSAPLDSLFSLGEGVTITPKSPPHYEMQDYGFSPQLTAAISRTALEGISKGAYTGCQVVVMKRGKMVVNQAYGTTAGAGSDTLTTDHIFDLASLTKTTSTLLAVMKLYDQGKLSLNDRVGNLLPWLKHTDKRDITIRQLLLHESGLPSTILFYREAIDKESFKGTLFRGQRDRLHPVQIGSKTWANPSFHFYDSLISRVPTGRHTLQVADSLWMDGSFKAEYRRLIAEAKLLSRSSRYSCVGFILLQQVVEAVTGEGLDRFVARHFYEPMGLTHTGYLPLRWTQKEQIVPSNEDKFLRRQLLQGFVHDESAAFQGGVSGNAGLFSTAAEVAQIYQMLLDGGLFQGKRYLSESTCRLFTSTTSRVSRRGLGFDRPSRQYPSQGPCAEEVSPSTYGHTGFTGTCAWVDPEQQMVYVFLSNRTYPQAWNPLLSRLKIRSRIQQLLYPPIAEE